MKRLLIVLLISFGISQANEISKYKSVHPKTRTFKSLKEFKGKHTQKKTYKIQKHKNITTNVKYHPHAQHRRYTNGYYNEYTTHTNHIYHLRPQRGYRHPLRSWFYVYKYTKADFVDRYGFYYGYFDRRGYMFEGEFYRYDRDYRYQDRIRGRGLFDRYYFYKPLPRIYRDDIYR